MRPRDRIINLLLICAGFGSVHLVYVAFFESDLNSYQMLIGYGTSVLAFCAAVEVKSFRDDKRSPLFWDALVKQFCIGTGLNLLLHVSLTYEFNAARTPFLIFLGGIFSAVLLYLRGRSNARRELAQQRFLLLGYDGLTERVIGPIREQVIGFVDVKHETIPAGIPHLGGIDALHEIQKTHRPTHLLISMKDWDACISPVTLWNLRLSGTELQAASVLYEKFFHRVCCERLEPFELLRSSALIGNSRTIAVQSIYTDLISVTLVVLLSPLILLIAIFVKLSGPGPVFDSSECAGFQYIPFRLLRFRTTRYDGTATMTAAGRWITRMGFANLPLLFNVVRGDMALVGPKPVRSEFARYLTKIMPFYAYRFSVKPGIIGWAQVHVPGEDPLPDEWRQTEYDLYYIKNGSVIFDIEIMLGSTGSTFRSKERRVPVKAAPTASL